MCLSTTNNGIVVTGAIGWCQRKNLWSGPRSSVMMVAVRKSCVEGGGNYRFPVAKLRRGQLRPQIKVRHYYSRLRPVNPQNFKKELESQQTFQHLGNLAGLTSCSRVVTFSEN